MGAILESLGGCGCGERVFPPSALAATALYDCSSGPSEDHKGARFYRGILD